MTKGKFSPLNINSLPGPDDITRGQLKNGITLLFRTNPNTLTTSIGGYIQAGSLYDPVDKLGLADFTADSLMRGTKTRSFQEIYDTLEAIGASLSIGSGTHTTGFGGKSLAEDLPILLEILSDALINPVFPTRNIERLRSQLLTELDLRAQNTGDMASLEFDKIIYQDHPYQHPTDGYTETIQAIQDKDLADFHSKHYGPRGMALAVVGPFEPDEVMTLVQEKLGSWTNPDQASQIQVPDQPALAAPVRKHLPIEDKSQVDLMIGAVGPPRSWEGFYAALIGNSILGQFGMMGRIGDSVRNQAGLAYYSYSSLAASIGPGQWVVSAGVAPENADRALDLIRDEIRKFIQEPVTAEELSDVQSNYIGKLPLTLESNAGVVSALITMEQHQLGLDYLRNYEKMIREISAESILDAARKYLDPEKLAVSSAGPEL